MDEITSLFTTPHNYLFAFGIAVLIGVWWARMTPTQSNLILAVGILAISIAVCFHPFTIAQPPSVRALWTVATLAVLGLAGYYVLWVPSAKPPVIRATVINANYPLGSVIGQIPWSSRFTDLRLIVSNNRGAPIKDIDFEITPDAPIVRVGQITNLSGVTFSAIDAPDTFVMQHRDGKTGTRTAVPLSLIGIDTGYRVQCKELAPNSKLEIVFAIASFSQCDGDQASPFKDRPRGGAFDRDYCFHLQSGTGQNAWYGYEAEAGDLIESPYAAQRLLPKQLEIKGSYSGAKGTQKVTQHIDLVDVFGQVISDIDKQINANPQP